jgi:hypothetical protein
MKRLVIATLLLCLLAVASEAAARPWVRKAEVDGRYAGKGHRTECTYTNCDEMPSHDRINWDFTPIDSGVAFYSITGDYHTRLDWKRAGYYFGARPYGAHWMSSRKVTALKQVRSDGVWIATKLGVTFRTWRIGAARYHDAFEFIIWLNGDGTPSRNRM